MHGQVTRAILTGLLGGLLLAGCGSGSKANVDAPPPPPPPPDAGTQPDGDDTDAGCDEDAMGTDWCIKNWPANVGGGELVKRVPPPVCIP